MHTFLCNLIFLVCFELCIKKGKLQKENSACIYHECTKIYRKNEQEFHFFKIYVYKRKPNPYFILLPKFRGELCEREIY